MIHFEMFSFDALPRTGAAWFLKAAKICELKQMPKSYGWGLQVSLVRHPYDWLYSIYQAMKLNRMDDSRLSIISKLSRSSKTFDDFAYACSTKQDIVGEVFHRMKFHTSMKIEEFPWGPIEFFESLGCEPMHIAGLQCLPPTNTSPFSFPPKNAKLKRMVMAAEKDFCEEYNYV